MLERMSKQKKKRLEEENFFKQFIELCRFQIEEYHQPESDPPDIAGKIGNDTFSIEITKLFTANGDKLIQRQKLIDRMTEKLNTASQTSILNNFGVLYELGKEIKISKKEEDRLVDSMIKIVKKKIDSNPNENYLNFKIPKNELPLEIAKFELRRFDGIKGKSWFTRKFWMSGPATDSVIVDKVSLKIESALQNGYYKRYDHNWLLLVVENEPHSDFSEFKPSLATIDNNIFDRIFILEKFEKKLIELIITKELKNN